MRRCINAYIFIIIMKDMLNDLHLGDEIQDGGDEWQAGDKSSDLQQWSAVGDTET